MKIQAVFAILSSVFPVYSLVSRQHLRIDPSATFGHYIPACDSLVPESSTSSTACWSSCGTQPSEARCNGQGENWQFSFVLRETPFKQTSKGTHGCSQYERRFLCTMLSSKNKECTAELAKKLNPGRQCYTKCGEPQCPEGDFLEPNPAEDFKYLHCEGGAYRTRCLVRKEEKPIEFNPVAVPIVVPVDWWHWWTCMHCGSEATIGLFDCTSR